MCGRSGYLATRLVQRVFDLALSHDLWGGIEINWTASHANTGIYHEYFFAHGKPKRQKAKMVIAFSVNEN